MWLNSLQENTMRAGCLAVLCSCLPLLLSVGIETGWEVQQRSTLGGWLWYIWALITYFQAADPLPPKIFEISPPQHFQFMFQSLMMSLVSSFCILFVKNLIFFKFATFVWTVPPTFFASLFLSFVILNLDMVRNIFKRQDEDEYQRSGWYKKKVKEYKRM